MISRFRLFVLVSACFWLSSCKVVPADAPDGEAAAHSTRQALLGVRLTVSPKAPIKVGESVTVALTGLPRLSGMWIAMYPPGANAYQYRSWAWVSPDQTKATLKATETGTFEVRLVSRSYDTLARADSVVTVTRAADPAPAVFTMDTPSADALVASQFPIGGACTTGATITVTIDGRSQTTGCVAGRWRVTATRQAHGLVFLRALSSSLPSSLPSAPIERRVIRSDGAVTAFASHALFFNPLPAPASVPSSADVAAFKIEPDYALHTYTVGGHCTPTQQVHERELYWMSLERTQSSGSTPWKLRFSRAGATVHGIFLPGTGNLIGDDSLTGFGIDRVLQTTWALAMPREMKGYATGHIHAAGSYADGNGAFCSSRRVTPTGTRNRPFYSPILAYEASANGALRVLTWPQASEIFKTQPGKFLEWPDRSWPLDLVKYYSEALLQSEYRDLGTVSGASAIQVDMVVMNYGATIKDITAPWFGGVRQVRRTGARVTIGTGVPGGLYEYPVREGFGIEEQARADRTGFTAFLWGSGNALALVHGNGGASTTRAFAPNALVAQGDTNRFPPQPGDNYAIIASPFRNNSAPLLQRNEVAHVRYFLVFGSQQNVKAASEQLAPHAGFNKWAFGARPSSRVELCLALGFDGCATLQATSVPAEAGAKPLFLLQDRTGRRFFATNPYCMTQDPGDGKSTIVGFAGWTVPAAGAGRVRLTSLAPNFGGYQKLFSTVGEAACIGPDDALLSSQ